MLKNSIAIVIAGLALVPARNCVAGPDLAPAREGVRLYNEKQYDKAAEKFTEAAKLNAANGVIQYNLGTSLAQSKKYDAAAEALGRSLNFEAAPPPADAYYNLAYTQVMKAQGDGGDAKAKADAAADPQARLEQLEKGMNTFKQAVLANPKDADAKYNYETTRLLIKQLKQQMKDQEQQGGNQGKDDKKSDKDKDKGNKDEKGENKDGEKKDSEGQEKQSDKEKQDEQQKKDQGDEQKPGDEQKEKQDKEDKESKQDEAGKEKSKEKEGKGDGKDKKQEEGIDKQPIPAATPAGSPTPAEGAEQAQPSDKQPTQEEIDAMRVLNSLSEDKPDQFKKLFQFKGAKSRVRPTKDW